jgi:ankyrin repeat protein
VSDALDEATGQARLGLEFLHAVREDNTDRAVTLVQTHPDLAGLSLRTAAAAGNLDAVHRHLAANPATATQAIPPDFTPPLVYAALSDVKRALGVPVETQVTIVRALLDAGANPNSTVPLPDQAGDIPVLYFPSISGNVPVAALLLSRGANATDGESLYHAAQHDRREILSLLATHGADLSRAPDGASASPLYFLAAHRAGSRLHPTVTSGMQWLLEQGADPNVPLTTVGADQRPSQLGECPLHRLATSGYGADVIDRFVAHGALVDVARADGVTPYQLALRSGNADAAAALERAGADASRGTPLDRLLNACLRGDEAPARTLTAAHPSLIVDLDEESAGALLVAIAEGRQAAVAVMLALGWPLDRESEWGGTPLHWAAWHGQEGVVAQLVAHGAPINHRDRRYGSSPLAWAAHGSRFCDDGPTAAYPRVVEQLLAAGATRAESINRWGEPPEQLASDDVSRRLKEHGFAQ